MNPNKILILIFILSFAFIQIEADTPIKDNCFECHKEMELMPQDFIADNIHSAVKLSCAECHGGDSSSNDMDIAMSSSSGFKTINQKDIPQLCGKCHSDINYMRKYRPSIATDQLRQYYQSTHGKQFQKGDMNVANCVSCHTAHGVLPAKNPSSSVYAINVPATCNKCHGNAELMEPYNLGNDQYEKYAGSVHGKALLERKDTGSPTCNDCHGNHGATPPGISSVANVCGMCHTHNEEYFSASKMGKAFKEEGFHGCVQCHNYHDIAKPKINMLKELCSDCHDNDSPAIQIANSMHSKLSQMISTYNLVSNKNDTVRNYGMNDEDINFMLKDINQIIIESHTLVHKFDSTIINNKYSEAQKLLENANQAAITELDNYWNRRTGFVYTSIAFLILFLGIFLKIKMLKKDNNS